MVRVRHVSAPGPNSCRWCGREQRTHGLFYARSVGNHYYTEPTPQQRLAPMRARRGTEGVSSGPRAAHSGDCVQSSESFEKSTSAT
ncbi:hypothetical protein GCM10027090_02300 [Sinomonas soli]